MKKIILAAVAVASIAAVSTAFAQSGGDAGSANKNIGAATSAPNNQSGTTDSRTTGATAPAPGGSSAGAATSHQGQAAADKKINTEEKK